MGCDNCADLGFTDDAGKVICPECNGTGNVTAQREADRELGRMVRETVRKLRVIMVGVTPHGYGVYANGAMQSEKMNTLDEAVRRALEAQ